MNIAMMRNSSMLEFRPLPFDVLECAGAACLTCAPMPLVFWMLSFMMPSSALVLSHEIIRCRNDYWGAVSEIEILG